ncbi:MAG TPA: glycosyltransferase family 2 protein [Parachlamydiaceae bacterium]|nr:glycosyltransferase family 2 protein [Parachlamydiaceae bacterium]
MSEEAVDILMATYNGKNYLKEQIESILKQSHQNFRILICDDSSIDSTPSMIDGFLREHPNRIFQLRAESKLGAKGNFSFLMQHAKAPYIMFSDQDDIWLEDKIAKALKAMKNLEAAYGKEKPLLVHTDLKVVDQNLNVLGNSFWKYVNLNAPSFCTLNHLLMQNAVTGCTIMMNKPLCQLSFPVPDVSLMHDWWVALVASAFGKIAVLNEQTILYRQHSSNTLGAKKFGTWNYFKGLWSKLLSGSAKKLSLQRLSQADAFLKNYDHLLNSAQKKMIQDYLKLKDFSFFKRFLVIKKHRFYRSGFLRNFLMLMVKWQP